MHEALVCLVTMPLFEYNLRTEKRAAHLNTTVYLTEHCYAT